MDDSGKAMTSDVIAAADWIYQNKSTYNIRVANFSLHSTAPASVFWDPLDRAVEKLWMSGVVVVTAAGNYGVNGQPTDVLYAPGNDPFVITVGADDVSGSVSMNDDTAAPWSVYGHTIDGFAKPELAAPGRYMIGPVPPTSTLAADPALGYFLRGARRLGTRGLPARPSSELDAGPGEGRADADGEACSECSAVLRGRRRNQRGERGERREPAEPEPGAEPLPHRGPERQLDARLRRGQLGLGGADGCLLGLGVLGLRVLGLRVLGLGFVGLGFLGLERLEHGVLGHGVLGLGVLGLVVLGLGLVGLGLVGLELGRGQLRR